MVLSKAVLWDRVGGVSRSGAYLRAWMSPWKRGGMNAWVSLVTSSRSISFTGKLHSIVPADPSLLRTHKFKSPLQSTTEITKINYFHSNNYSQKLV